MRVYGIIKRNTPLSRDSDTFIVDKQEANLLYNAGMIGRKVKYCVISGHVLTPQFTPAVRATPNLKHRRWSHVLMRGWNWIVWFSEGKGNRYCRE